MGGSKAGRARSSCDRSCRAVHERARHVHPSSACETQHIAQSSERGMCVCVLRAAIPTRSVLAAQNSKTMPGQKQFKGT